MKPREVAAVVLERVEKHYGSTPVLLGIDLEVAGGEFVSLLGPSGSGKTTTLRIIAGLVHPSRGRILIRGKDVTAVPAHLRDLAMVFQQYALFPHLTVEENVRFGLRMRGVSRRAGADRVMRALELARMQDFRGRFPSQLSGGQQQRVGLARCLAVDPAVLLLDEPFGALDRKLREEMQREFRELQQRLGITTIFVTHDQDEALALSERVVVMNEGRIEQAGTPNAVYRHPRSLFVASFVGTANVWKGRCIASGEHEAVIEVLGHKIMVPSLDARTGGDIMVMVRPEDVKLFVDSDNVLPIAGVVKHDFYKGATRSVVVDVHGGEQAICEVPGDLQLSSGMAVRFAVAVEQVRMFPCVTT